MICWGANWPGQIDSPRGEFAAVSAGGAHTCGMRVDGAVICWGENESGQLMRPLESSLLYQQVTDILVGCV